MYLAGAGREHNGVLDGFAPACVERWEAGLKADDVAAKYRVSRGWEHWLVQRRRDTGDNPAAAADALSPARACRARAAASEVGRRQA